MAYRDLARVVNTRPSAAEFASGFCTRIKLERGASRRRISYLLVEGPDDMSAIQKLTHQSCTVDWAGSKDHVIRALKSAASGMDGRICPFDGIAGLVDRDLEHLAGDQPQSPRICSYQTCNDLESAVLYFRWHDVLESFVKRSALDTHLHWLSFDREESVVARRVCAPIGLIRALHRSENRNYKAGQNHTTDKRMGDFFQYAEPILKPLCSEGYQESKPISETLDTLASVYLRQFENVFHLYRPTLLRNLQSYEARLESQPWDFVRGKDVLDSLAYIIGSLPESDRIFPTDSFSSIKQRLSTTIVQLVDPILLDETGILTQFGRIKQLDRNEYEYFEQASP